MPKMDEFREKRQQGLIAHFVGIDIVTKPRRTPRVTTRQPSQFADSTQHTTAEEPASNLQQTTSAEGQTTDVAPAGNLQLSTSEEGRIDAVTAVGSPRRDFAEERRVTAAAGGTQQTISPAPGGPRGIDERSNF